MKTLKGPLIVNGWIELRLHGRMGWVLPDEVFDDCAAMVATAIALGLGLPCHPREDADERFIRQIDALHVALRPVRTMQIGSDHPELTLIKSNKKDDPENEA